MKKLTSSIWLFIISIIMLANTIVYAKTPPPPPVNDECPGAILITPTPANSYTIYYDNLNSSVSTGVPLPQCASPLGGDVWFAVIVPASGHLIFDSKAGTMTDGGMAIYSGSCNNLFFIACNDNKSATTYGYPDAAMPQIDKCGLNLNDTIFIRFWGKGVSNFGTFLLSVIAAPLQAPCTNPGFENGYNGWFATLGQQYDGAVGAATPVYFPILFNNTADANFELVTSGIDAYGGFPKVYSGLKSVKIGETSLAQTYDAASIEQTFTVGPMNTMFVYHYAVVLQSGGHPTYQQPFFKVELFDANGNSDSCGLNTLAMPNSTLIQSSSSGTYYKPWTTVNMNLSAYSGQNVTVRFTSSDCSPTGHFGYAYLDCECQPYAITSSRDTVCAGNMDTLNAPSGAVSYLWSPGGATTQSIVVTPNITTTYSCIVSNSGNGGCAATISKTIYTGQSGSPNPSAAGNITSNGNNNVSQNQNNVLYIVPPINNTSRYDWYYSGSGVSFYPSNKTTTDSVWLNFSSTATSGNLTVRGHNNCGLDGAFSADYPINVGVGVTENKGDAQFKMYPNPAKDNLIIELNGNIILQNTAVSIFNIQGQLLKQTEIKEGKTAIDIQSFASGIYIVKLNNAKESFVSRFVKE
ncbi:MAG: T9SS type A sorting domain-containing protein [Bacteroidetes bacterium]|nr:T9SS type A sorting domain-containing protein [Bacteroidota bacterium]